LPADSIVRAPLDSTLAERRFFFGWVVVGCAFTILCIAYGIQFTFGVFMPFIFADTGWDRGSLSLPYSVYVFAYSALGVVSGRLTDRLGPRIVLMVGGYDKQIDLTPLAEAVARKVKAVALMGQTADALSWLLESLPGADGLPTQECDSFEGAFTWAVNQSEPGDVVLLSPGCASYDWFRNYAERGERFSEMVRGWSPAMAQG